MKENECHIQFLETNHYVTFGTAIAAFYVPVTVMCFLYWRIWRETEKRQKDLPNLQAGKKDSSKRSNSRYVGYLRSGESGQSLFVVLLIQPSSYLFLMLKAS